jgi:two-component system, NtrC family, sensor kinase
MTGPVATRPKILVVDDDVLSVRMLNNVLKSRYVVVWAGTGMDALAKASSESPELILLDVGLPDVDGYEVCRQLQKNPATRDIPVMFLTRHDEHGEIIRGFEAGGKDYVLKGASIQELMARIGTHLEIRRQKVSLEDALAQNRMQNVKMASLGQLAAGVAHEINNPMGYISSNLSILVEYFEQIVGFHQTLRVNYGLQSPETLWGSKEARAVKRVLDDGIDLINESRDGAERITTIVQELKNFSRLDALEQKPVGLSTCMESALTICFNELKYVAKIRKEYEPTPDVLCHPGQLNQVFLNLLVNAGQAITKPMGEIVLRSWYDDTHVYASVSDSGMGIPPEQQERIFDPFYTTKEVGKGTGLGLSISQEIIARHCGEFLLCSQAGKGTTFTVKLPRMVSEEE